MTTEHEASRTLVKSPPELWAECSVAESLTRHLAGSFGEIRITRLEPETAVAWEGEHASGTVRLEPSGWGTRVTLTAQTEAEEVVDAVEVAPVAEEVSEEEHEPIGEVELVEEEQEADQPTEAPRRPRLIDRVRAFFKGPEPVVSAGPGPEPADPGPEPAEPEPELGDLEVGRPEPTAAEPTSPAPAPCDPEAVLAAALDSLGQAHHRPFSRA